MKYEVVYAIILLEPFGDLAHLNKAHEGRMYITPEAAWREAKKLGSQWGVYSLDTIKRRLHR